MTYASCGAWLPRVPKTQDYPDLPQPRWHKEFSHPLLNPVEGKLPVARSAAILAEYDTGKAIGAPPLKWSRHAALTCCHSWNTFGIEDTTQVGIDPRDEFVEVGAL
jgi:hypothetical protein